MTDIRGDGAKRLETAIRCLRQYVAQYIFCDVYNKPKWLIIYVAKDRLDCPTLVACVGQSLFATYVLLQKIAWIVQRHFLAMLKKSSHNPFECSSD
jgi:hypothetical protein